MTLVFRGVDATLLPPDEMLVGFCVDALKEAQARSGRPEFFNSDQGSRFICFDFTAILRDAGVRISTDGGGRWMDNVFIEQLIREARTSAARDCPDYFRGSYGAPGAP